MQIGELAAKAEVKISTIRFYERAGLLPAPGRSQGGRRLYQARDLQRLRFIRQAQEFGFALNDIRHLLATREHGGAVCSEVQTLAQRELARTDYKLEHLRAYRRELQRTLARWQQQPQPTCSSREICGLIERPHGPIEKI
ncbi:MAG: MerR family transcriptional regulator [Acidobacteria bacterium]|nr:MAG: MerR family transcriptional regulator [Acidobacteriota bacterium]